MKEFKCYFWFVGWDCISFGFHICFLAPNLEIHLPFGFIRIGWESKPIPTLTEEDLDKRCFGIH